MNAFLLVACTFLFAVVVRQPGYAQTIQLGEVLIVHTPVLKAEVDPAVFEAHVVDAVLPAWQGLGDGVETHLFRADRGKDEGRYWMVWSVDTRAHRRALMPEEGGALFSSEAMEQTGAASELSDRYVSEAGGTTEYELMGADALSALPAVALLGVHYIQVRDDRAEAFEAFVRDTLHPALVGRIPGMDLLYYKGVRGEHTGRYLTVFAIESVEARERYWPTGASETEALKEAFAPLAPIAEQLRTYLVEGSYLKKDTGAAAAIFESLEWTDFAFLR